MAKFEFDKIVSGEEIKDMIAGHLGSKFRIALKKKCIEIVQDAAKGCVIRLQEREGRTVCKGPYGYMPSVGLRMAIILGYFVLSFLIGLSIGYLVVGGGLPMIILYLLLMKAPSRALVRRVAGILGKVALKV